MAPKPAPEGNLYAETDAEARTAQFTEAVARNRDAIDRTRIADVAGAKTDAAAARQTANAIAGQVSQANTTAGSAVAIAQGAAAEVDQIKGPIQTRLGYLETREGLAPGDVYDAETASVLAQDGSLSQTVLNAQNDQRIIYRATPTVARGMGWNIATDEEYAGGMGSSGDDRAALLAALAGPNRTVYIPEGEFDLSDGFDINAFSGKRITGNGQRTVLRFGNLSQPAIRGLSSGATDFSMDNLVLDLGWSAGMAVHNAVQITNGQRIEFHRVKATNSGGAGFLFQGLGAGQGSHDCKVMDSEIDGTGLADGTTGFGIHFKDASTGNEASGNRFRRVKGGFGIGFSGAANTGWPTHNIINRNHITMLPSTTHFEAIGLTAGCDFNVITNNVIPYSYDNGISVGGQFNVVMGNIVSECYNHGVGLHGSRNVVSGNTFRNVGRENSQDYGGVSIDGSEYNIVTNNIMIDEATSGNRMAYQVKFVNSKGNNLVSGNTGYGWRAGRFTPLNQGRVPSDNVQWVDGGETNHGQYAAMDGPTDQTKAQRYKNNGVTRWATIMPAGANPALAFRAYDSAGVSLGDVLSLDSLTRTARFPQGMVLPSRPSAIADGDYPSTPPDGAVSLDTASHRLYIRSGGTWRYLQLT